MIWLSKHKEKVEYEYVENEQELKDIFEKSETAKYVNYEDFKNNGFQYYDEEQDFLTEVSFTIEELLELDDDIDIYKMV